MTKYVVENGMRIEVPADASLSYLRKAAPKGRETDDVMIEDADGMLRPIQEGEQLPNGAKIFRVPEIEKGSGSRIDQEVNILRDQIKGRGREVRIGKKSLSGRTYTGLIVKNFRLNPSKYKDSKTDLLFLLPPEYPTLPALGCYMHFPHKTKSEADHHQTLRAFYGAPELQDEGWYWYCVGFGRNFASHGYSAGSRAHEVWQPAGDPALGHNLVTLYSMADRGINTP
jgi:hypothetical protein